MIDREFAVRLVEAQLERESPGQLRVTDVREHELVWVVSYQSAEYLRTGDPSRMLVGGGPFLVDRIDGGLHSIGGLSAHTGAWEDDYRTRIRKTATRTVVDDLHDELRRTAATRGRIFAMHVLRKKVPVLAHAEVIEYVNAVQSGSAPAHLLAISTAALVPQLDPVLGVRTIQPGQHTTG
ncbi:YrhB domain-containing protein [Streptomyces neyagawaensis]|uniref:YrhB domain-containing protein n=1 Tax=Streptomyces neyagawaensis TaxID=42238 RepID=UPI0006E20189|nr:YrhB domain-containing protein [Streptomyces neyagawaensis]MCL6731044.1 YrhB family protein [Streptomyces neyagawaensis]MDE1686234.1 YrhB domain-containing protein [Streptomyces neyagawaensis]